MAINPLVVTAKSLVSSMGVRMRDHEMAIRECSTGLTPNDTRELGLSTWVGMVPGLENMEVHSDLSIWDCRNNRLAQLGMEQEDFSSKVSSAAKRYGTQRIGLFLGTSTSGIREAEKAYAARPNDTDDLPEWFNYSTTQNIASLGGFCRRYLGLNGPVTTISTACSSSAKVFASAWRYIQAGLCDAAVVGGVDSLCLTTLFGFKSLELLSEEPCRPFDKYRKGISIGEAAGFVLLERDSGKHAAAALIGFGESSDAYHMSTPHPEGLGAVIAMREALDRSGLEPEQIDYVNLHGTGTALNDKSEARAMQTVFMHQPAASSTKGWTGHTLGAAGIVEAILSIQALENAYLPCNLNKEFADELLGITVLTGNQEQQLSYVMSNSFGFGGSNCSLVFGLVS